MPDAELSVSIATAYGSSATLPRQLTSFVGREDAIVHIEQLLATSPLVTFGRCRWGWQDAPRAGGCSAADDI